VNAAVEHSACVDAVLALDSPDSSAVELVLQKEAHFCGLVHKYMYATDTTKAIDFNEWTQWVID
jgi:hypothetical protein